MRITVFLTLLAVPVVYSSHSVSFNVNTLVSLLKYDFCSPFKVEPQRIPWPFRGFIKQYNLTLASGTDVSVNCSEGIPVLVITCDEGLYLSDGSQSKSIFCLDETCPDFENCTAIVCDQETINNANVTSLPQSDYLDTVSVSCNTGYTLQDGSDLYTAECQLNGQWSIMESCIAKPCQITSISNSKLPGDQLPVLSFPGKLRVECDDGYEIANEATFYETECASDGTWTRTDSCTDVDNSDDSPIPEMAFESTYPVNCQSGFVLSDGQNMYTATCQADGTWSRTDSCIVDGTSSGYTYSPRTGKFYKYVKPGSEFVYTAAETMCKADNTNAVVAPPPEADIIWLLNITVSGTRRNGGWVEAQKADTASPWLLSDDTIIPTYYWCVNQPQYLDVGPWCIFVNSCWFPRPCRWGREAVICQLG